MGWQMFVEGRRSPMGGRDEELERMMEDAYREGCEHGKREAYERMQDGYGDRRGYTGGMDGDYDGGYDGGRYDGDDYGDRRGVKNTGRYAGEYRRRRRY